MKNNFLRFLKWLSPSVIVFFVASTIYEQISQLYFNAQKPGNNEFVKVDGINIHFVKKGKGGPTVVFQSGLGGDYKIWEEIQDSMSKSTTTISYDRAGLQWSDHSGQPKTLESITRELEVLLEKTNCPKPYIFVGHSLAGLTLRPIIAKHEKDVKGVVFLDVAHPLQIKESSTELKKYLVVPPNWLITSLIETGLARIYFNLKPFVADLPTNHFLNKHVANYFYRSYQTFLQEAREDDAMFDEAAKIKSFGNVPLKIVTGAYPKGVDFSDNPKLIEEYLGLHRANQKDLLHLSTKSQQIIAPNSGHYVQLQDAKTVIDAIKAYL